MGDVDRSNSGATSGHEARCSAGPTTNLEHSFTLQRTKVEMLTEPRVAAQVSFVDAPKVLVGRRHPIRFVPVGISHRQPLPPLTVPLLWIRPLSRYVVVNS